jgi:hypothetical protein
MGEFTGCTADCAGSSDVALVTAAVDGADTLALDGFASR